MNHSRYLKTAVCLATIALVAACGGDSPSSAPSSPGARTSTSAASLLTVGSGFDFDGDPVIRIVPINNNNLIDPTGGTIFKLGQPLTKDSNGDAIDTSKYYLITLATPTGINYISPTRNAANENCAETTGTSGRLCAKEEGRKENLKTTWRAITNFKDTANVNPLSTLVTERVRTLLRPSTPNGKATIAAALDSAERELVNALFAGSSNPPTALTSMPLSLESLAGSGPSTAGVAIGMLERLAQQMFKTIGEKSAAAGYSVMYDTLFSSFARDGRFDAIETNSQGSSIGLRSVGSLLNSALTEFLIKDAPRFNNDSVANLRLPDFLNNPASRVLRTSLSMNYQDLYDATNGAATSVAYVSKDAGGKPREHVITAIAARTGGVFFLDSRGEAQDGSKPSVRCGIDKLKLANYEVTGVAALEGASAPIVVAYNHTSTRAVLIDVRQVGLDAASTASERTCTLTDSALRVVDFRDVGQNSALYQNSPQYQHTFDSGGDARPVTLTSVAFNAVQNQIKITTLDGILSFDLLPSSAANDLPLQTRYRDFVSYGSPNVGLSMNPSFDSTALLPGGLSSVWSPFDYNTDTSSADPDPLRGLYSFKTVMTLKSADVPKRRGVIPQMGALASQFGDNKGLAITSGLDDRSQPLSTDKTTDGNADNELFKTRNSCLNPAEPFKRYAPIDAYATAKFSRGDSIIERELPRYTATLPVPVCTTGTLSISQVANASDTYPNTTQRRLIYTCSGGGGLALLGGTPPSPTYVMATSTTGGLGNKVDTDAELEATTGAVTSDEKFGACEIGYHGVALQNRYGNASQIDGIAVGAKNPFIFEQGLIQSLRFSSGAARSNDKPFVVLSPDRTKEKRQLVLDDVRSYGVLFQRGTFNKSLAYFLAKEPGANNATTYSLIEVDLDSVRNIQNADKPSGSYTIPTTAAESKQIAGPIRVYFR